jgi:hypothetical protein
MINIGSGFYRSESVDTFNENAEWGKNYASSFNICAVQHPSSQGLVLSTAFIRFNVVKDF